MGIRHNPLKNTLDQKAFHSQFDWIDCQYYIELRPLIDTIHYVNLNKTNLIKRRSTMSFIRYIVGEYDFMIKVFNLIILIVSVFALLKYIGYRHKKPIIHILKLPFYSNFILLIRIVFSFRQNTSLRVREFIEFSIIEYPIGKITQKTT